MSRHSILSWLADHHTEQSDDTRRKRDEIFFEQSRAFQSLEPAGVCAQQAPVPDRSPDHAVFLDRHHLIACDEEIVYIGQSNDLMRRPLQSMSKAYHRVADTSLQWGIAYSPCEYKDMDEQESTAIRAFSPRFNTSIPSVAKSQGKMPEIEAWATVFQTPDELCHAFLPESLHLQMERAAVDPDPPWRWKRTRRETERPIIDNSEMEVPAPMTEERRAELMRDYGVPVNEPLVYPVNLCEDGTVVTRDGEVLGSWSLNDDACPFFIPDGETEPLFGHVNSGGLARRIRDWHEERESGAGL